MAWLYAVTHRDSGRIYIGWTSFENAEIRWDQHKLAALRYRSRQLFCKAIRKYGVDAFDWEVVQWFDTDAEAKQAEIYWIDRLNTNALRGGHGYNMTDGGDGLTGPQSPELRGKINEALRRPDVREKMSAWQRGRLLSEEHRTNIRDTMRSPEARQKMSEIKRKLFASGHVQRHSPEAKAKISAARKKYWAERRARTKDA